MTAIATLITRTRKRLHDEDAAAYRWTDAHLTEHLEATIREYSEFYPQEKTTTAATTNGSRDISVAAYTDLIRVVAVEYPAGNYPKTFVPFNHWGSTVTALIDTAFDTSNASVYWHALHATDGSTHPTHHDEMITLGAAAAAALELANYAVDKLNVTGEATSRQYAEWGKEAMERYRKWLERGRRVVGQFSMYSPALPRASESTDPGPP